jgi:outer membrane protein assembly factor BamB
MKTILAFVALLFLALPTLSQDAPMFRGNLEHTGVYSAAGIPKFNGVEWKFHTSGRVISSPVVEGGLVYVGSTDKNFYAIDQQTGALKWKFATEGPVVSSPAVSGGIAYFGSYNGKFYALDAATGQLKWKFETGGERRYAGRHLHGLLPAGETMPDPWDYFLSSPAVWNGGVYFGSGDGNVYALDAASGVLKWKFKTGDVVHSSPAISGGALYIGSWDTYLYALDATSGKELWRFKTGEDAEIHNHVGIQASPAIADGTVYFGCRDSNVYALDAKTGKQKWLYSTKGSWVNNSAAVYDGKVFFGTSLPGLLHAVDAKTGAEIFSLDTKFPVFASIAIANDMLYFGTLDGKFTAVDLKTQKPVWVFQSDTSKQNLPAIQNPDGTLNFGVIMSQNFYDDMVIAVGKLLSVGSILSSPVVVKDVIYVGSTDGNLYALD